MVFCCLFLHLRCLYYALTEGEGEGEGEASLGSTAEGDGSVTRPPHAARPAPHAPPCIPASSKPRQGRQRGAGAAARRRGGSAPW